MLISRALANFLSLNSITLTEKQTILYLRSSLGDPDPRLRIQIQKYGIHSALRKSQMRLALPGEPFDGAERTCFRIDNLRIKLNLPNRLPSIFDTKLP